MRKLKLEIGDIQVQSFRTSDARGYAGTVRGHVEGGFEIVEGDDAKEIDTLDIFKKTCDTCVPGCPTRTCETRLGCTGCT